MLQISQQAVSTIFVHYCTSMTISKKMLNSSGGRIHFCKTPATVPDQSVSSLFAFTVLNVQSFMFSDIHTIFSGYPTVSHNHQKYLSISCQKPSWNQCNRGTGFCWTLCIFCELFQVYHASVPWEPACSCESISSVLPLSLCSIMENIFPQWHNRLMLR